MRSVTKHQEFEFCSDREFSRTGTQECVSLEVHRKKNATHDCSGGDKDVCHEEENAGVHDGIETRCRDGVLQW